MVRQPLSLYFLVSATSTSAGPRQVPAVRAGDGLADEATDSPLEQWHMFAGGRNVRVGSVVLLALQEDVPRSSHPSFTPAHGWRPWLRHGN